MEFEVAEEQAGFRQDRGTAESLRSLVHEQARAHRQPLFSGFIDFEKAFDTVYLIRKYGQQCWIWVSHHTTY